MPERIQLSRAKGWRKPDDTVSVARPGRWGNPFKVEDFGRERAIKLFDDTMQGRWSPSLFDDSEPDELIRMAHEARTTFLQSFDGTPLAAARAELRGKNLACWCKPTVSCHADVLLRLANEPP